jgi:hypothetical protein
MRRTISIILFILGGWILASEAMMAWITVGGAELGLAGRLGMIGIMAGFAMPFLLLGMWVSPGNRFADIGMTMMIAGGIGAALALMMFMIWSDPGMKQFMPPDKPMPQFGLAPALGIANLLVIGGGGWLLWRFGRRTRRNPNDELERAFGDG